VEDQAGKVRQAMSAEDADAMRRETEALNQILSQVGTAAYQQAEPAAGTPPEDGGPQPGQQGGPEGEDVVDGEYRNV
jgi:hypothetical protein